MAYEYRGYIISAWARPDYGKGCTPVGIVCKPTSRGSTVEVKRIEGRIFKSKEEAEQNGLELCKSWIDKRLDAPLSRSYRCLDYVWPLHRYIRV